MDNYPKNIPVTPSYLEYCLKEQSYLGLLIVCSDLSVPILGHDSLFYRERVMLLTEVIWLKIWDFPSLERPGVVGWCEGAG